MKTIPNKVSFFWILATILLTVLVSFPPVGTRISVQNRGVLITAIVVFSFLSLLIFSKKLSKNYSPQPSDIPMIEKAILGPGIICSIFLILSTYDILDWAINSREPEFAGWEFLLFVPIILLSLAAQISPLIFLLAKKSKKAIILLIIQCFLLLSFVGVICLFHSISDWSFNRNSRESRIELEKFLSTPRIKNLALLTPGAPGLSFKPNFKNHSFIEIKFIGSPSDSVLLFNVYKAESLDGPWELIQGDLYSYTNGRDFDLPKKIKTLYYRVAVSDGNYGEGQYSPISSVNLP